MAEAKIQLDNGKTLTITAKNQSQKNVYVERVRINGKLIKGSSITNDDIMNGGDLVFEMRSKPNKN